MAIKRYDKGGKTYFQVDVAAYPTTRERVQKRLKLLKTEPEAKRPERQLLRETQDEARK